MTGEIIADGKKVVVTQAVQNDSMAALKARVSQFETGPAPTASPTDQSPLQATTATASPQEPAPSTQPQADQPAAAPNKEDVPKQFQDKDGNVDMEKLQKSTDSLQQELMDREAALKKYKELQRSFTQTSQELKRVEQETRTQRPDQAPQPQAPQPTVPEFALPELPEDFRQRVAQDLERDAVGTVVALARAIAAHEVKPIRTEFETRRMERAEQEKLDDLQRLTEQPGNEWMMTKEGMARFERVFQANPYLWSAERPYSAATRFMDDLPAGSGRPSGSAQAAPLTPILGANGAVPPPQSQPPASTGQMLNELGAQMRTALERGQVKRAQEIHMQMDKIAQGY